MNKLYKGITRILHVLRLEGVASYLVIGVLLIAWGTYELLSPTSQYNLTRHYKKKRPYIFTIGVTCLDEYTGNSNYLVIKEEHSFRIGKMISGDLIRFPILYFNNKMVSRALDGRHSYDHSDLGLPVDPIERAKLEIKTFHHDNVLAGRDWIVYVDPAKFTHREYQQIIGCYEAHREEIDSILKASKFIPWWTRKEKSPRSFGFYYLANYISHIVYGAMPQPQIFSPPKISKSYLLSDGQLISISDETLKIYPNGQWQIDIRRKWGKFPWHDCTMGKGKVIFSDMGKVFDVEWLNFSDSLESIENISVYEYLASFIDSQGNKLTDFYSLGNIPSKFNTIEVYGK